MDESDAGIMQDDCARDSKITLRRKALNAASSSSATPCFGNQPIGQLQPFMVAYTLLTSSYLHSYHLPTA